MKLLSMISIATTVLGFAQDEFKETLFKHWGQTMTISKVLYEEKNPVQHLLIFETPRFGRVLALDGVVQITEGDEFIYQEMMVHVPLLAHGNAKDVLIIGGGDGAILRRVLQYAGVERVTLVEIDPAVVEFSKRYLGYLSQGAFNDPRVTVTIQDGYEFVKNTSSKYDIVISDSPDPEGSAAILFTPEFYEGCKRVLNPKGIFVNHAGVPFMQTTTIGDNYHFLSHIFNYADFYVAPIPSYIGGFMAFGFSSDTDYSDLTLEQLTARREKLQARTRYYNPRIHLGSFALPEYMIDLLIPKT